MTSSLEPEAFIGLMRQADRLESLPRTGWVVSRVPNPESIAAHTYGVCLGALMLVDAIAGRPDPPDIDRELVLTMALLHDLCEAITTDIPAPVKDFMGREQVKEAERRATEKLLAPLDSRYIEIWEEYEAKDSLEARIVSLADNIQMMVKALQYESAGHGDLRRFWANEENFEDYGVPEARAIFDRLRRYHDEEDWPVEVF